MYYSVMPETARTKTRSGSAADSGVLAAVLDELVDQQWILSEMQVHVAGQQVGRHEPFVADHVAVGVLHLVGGLQVAVVPGDAAPVELMPAVERAAGGQDVVREGEELPVPEAMDLTVHLDVDRDHPRHLMRHS